MAVRPSSRSSTNLEPPRKSVELHDPGARDLDSSADEEYFSDASEGRRRVSRPASPLRETSPIPKTRVELVDDKPAHGEEPGTPAYDKRGQDAVPDEIVITPEERQTSQRNSMNLEPAISPGGSAIPRTVVEKVDPASPSHGEVPGTAAYAQRLADATPDIVLKAPEPGKKPPVLTLNNDAGDQPQTDMPIPETVITGVDSRPAHGEVEGTTAYDMRTINAAPDILKREGDSKGSPTLDRSPFRSSARRKSSLNTPTAENGFGDEFDEFEEGAEAGADDDFGDFDGGFERPPVPEDARPFTAQKPSPPLFPLIDYEEISSYDELVQATQSHLDAMFPSTTAEQLATLPDPDPIPSDSHIFPSDRSRSLWKQLITPPPLQPPNWTKSRIRRLFLVSLGVPVDLDEILPPSKQKKLILPDINIDSPGRPSESDKALGSIARLKVKAANDSNASVDSVQSGQVKPPRRRARGPPPPPDLDLVAVRRFCATTVEKLDGFEDEELQEHVESLQSMMEKTKELLEYWLKRRDGALKEKEAFEGVIENLVRHARRVRK